MEESGGGLDLVEVEGVVAGHGAVEPGLEEGGPPVPELVGASLVVLANSSNPRVNLLATVHELNCRLPASNNLFMFMMNMIFVLFNFFAEPEEEVDMLLVLKGADKIWCWGKGYKSSD